VAAYRALDRRAAPPAMRQNALYAAAQIQRRQGRLTAATADFERALAAAPRGALHEDALVGAMESARAGGDGARARALAARYLEEFPRGLAAATARMLAGDGAP
jgi:outer membrane protein assembly factor BamD (BamD/ComL family)